MNLWRLRMLTAASIHKLLPSSPRQPPVRCGSSHVEVFHSLMKYTQPEAKPVLFLCKFQVIFCKKEAHQAGRCGQRERDPCRRRSAPVCRPPAGSQNVIGSVRTGRPALGRQHYPVNSITRSTKHRFYGAKQACRVPAADPAGVVGLRCTADEQR